MMQGLKFDCQIRRLSITSRRKGKAEYKISLPKVLDLVVRIIGKCLGLTNFGDGLFAYAWKE